MDVKDKVAKSNSMVQNAISRTDQIIANLILQVLPILITTYVPEAIMEIDTNLKTSNNSSLRFLTFQILKNRLSNLPMRIS